MRIAVVDIGTNSTRLLVCEVDGSGVVTELERDSNVTRLGQGVDATGRLADEAIGRVRAVLGDYARRIAAAGADRTVGVLTSAVRDAANGAEFTERVRADFGIDAANIAGTEEARLTFLGATAERRDADPVLVIDIGGGSTELVVGAGTRVSFDASLQIGVVRLTERHITTDPPEPDELRALAADIERHLAEHVPQDVRRQPATAVAVAGTATSIAGIDLELDPYDPRRVHGHRVTLGRAEELLARLATMDNAQRRELAGLHPDRAPTIVAGVVILAEVLRAFGLEDFEASEQDILHGVARDAAAARSE